MKRISFIFFFLAIASALHAQQKTNPKQTRDKVTEVQKAAYTESMLLQYMRTNGSGVQVLQLGDHNVVNAEANQLQVSQVGNQQSLYFTKSSKLQPSNINVNMQGANNYIEIQGNNSITENMTINMSGNERSLIIRNYR